MTVRVGPERHPRVVPTTVFGRRFRSTTEARWAVFMTEAGIAWEYEPETYDLGDLGWYLPDFWLPGPEWFLEVKPGRTKMLDEDYDRAKRLHQVARRPVLVVNGFGLPSISDPRAPGWIYDIFDLGDPDLDSAGAGGAGWWLSLYRCGCPLIIYGVDGAWYGSRCRRDGHGRDGRDRAIDWTRQQRAYEAAAAYRPGR